MSLKVIGFLSALTIALSPTLVLAQSDASTTTSTASSTDATTTAPVIAPPAPVLMNQTQIEAKVRADFADAPVMIAIARCESKFRQFTDAGNVLDGGSGGMIGVFQISKSVHTAYAKSLGFDITTVEGNLGYARYLYSKEGTDPWISSFPCWSAAVNNPESNPTNAAALAINTDASTLTNNLSFGMINPQIITLQQLLNKMGYTISPDGPGSIGNETNKFGSLTRVAVRRFQCAKNIVCTGDEGSTGYGYVGARTRASLQAANPGDSAAPVTAQSPVPPTTQPDNTAKIAALQTQIDQYQKMIADLQTQIAALKGN